MQKNKIYRHHKGGLYELICIAVQESDKQPVVVYRSMSDQTIWVRPVDEFTQNFKREINHADKTIAQLVEALEKARLYIRGSNPFEKNTIEKIDAALAAVKEGNIGK